MKIDHTDFLVAIKRMIFPTFIQKFTDYLKKKKKKKKKTDKIYWFRELLILLIL